MKRAAICLSGLVRTFEKTHSNLMANLVEANPDYHCDFFLSTWANADSRSSSQSKRLQKWGQSIEDLIPVTPTPVERLIEIYRPIAINIEEEKVWDVERFAKNQDTWASPEAWLGMTHKIADCDRLRRAHEVLNLFNYDVVVRHRFDTMLPDPITFEIDPEKLYVPLTDAPTYRDQPWTNDMFSLGSGKVMGAYAGAFQATDELFESGVMFQPEILMYNHLLRRGVTIEVMQFRLEIVRS